MTRYERPLVSNGLVTITSDYEHVITTAYTNLLKFQLDFSQGGWAKEEIKIISHELKNTAKYFAEEQGLAPGMPGSKKMWEEDEFHVNSGTLYNSIDSKVDGFDVKLTANAQNSRGQYYAGHIEYGFHDRGDNLVPARPFLRPALYAVSEATKGHLGNVMKNLINSMWQPGGYQGYQNITFNRLIPNRNKGWSLLNQPLNGKKSGLMVRNRLSQLRTDRVNNRTKFRDGASNKAFTWDRQNINNRLRELHPKWYNTYLRHPSSVLSKKERKSIAGSARQRFLLERKKIFRAVLFGEGTLNKKQQQRLTTAGRKRYSIWEKRRKNRLRQQRFVQNHPKYYEQYKEEDTGKGAQQKKTTSTKPKSNKGNSRGNKGKSNKRVKNTNRKQKAKYGKTNYRREPTSNEQKYLDLWN